MHQDSATTATTTTHDFYSKCIVKQKPDFWQEPSFKLMALLSQSAAPYARPELHL